MGAAASRLFGFADRNSSFTSLLVHPSLVTSPLAQAVFTPGIGFSSFTQSARYNQASRFDVRNTSAVIAYLQASGELPAISQAFVLAST